MSLTIDQLRNFAGTGGISIDAGSNAKPAEIKKTGFLHAIKTFFGFKSAKAQNEATINAIRSAILSDPKLFLAHERSNELLGAVKGTITAEKVRTIISDLTRTVDGMMGFQKKEAVTAYIRGRVAAAGIPKFAKGLGKEVGPQFMAYYAKTIAYAAMKDGEPEAGWGSVDFSAKIKEFKKTMSGCFKIIGDNPEDRKAFASMVSDNRTKILNGKGPEECLKIARETKALFDKAHELAGKYGKISEKLAMESIKSMDYRLSPDVLEKIVDAGRKMDTSDLKWLENGIGVNNINKALDGFIKKFNDVVKVALKGLPGDLSSDAKLAIQELIIHNAVDSLPHNIKENMANAFATNGRFVAEEDKVKEKFMQIMRPPLEMATQIDIDNPAAYKDEAVEDIIPNLVVENPSELSGEDSSVLEGQNFRLFDV